MATGTGAVGPAASGRGEEMLLHNKCNARRPVGLIPPPDIHINKHRHLFEIFEYLSRPVILKHSLAPKGGRRSQSNRDPQSGYPSAPRPS